jgi:glycosyltransferase involved in cell wall biosynthesis
MPTVTIDASDARGGSLRGWGRYVSCLLEAFAAGARGELEIDAAYGWPYGPEFIWEQFGLPRRARQADLVHAPNCFLPLRRACPGVVTIHDLAFEVYPTDFAPRTRLKYRAIAPRAARSAELVISVSRFTADELIERYGVDPGRIRVIALAPALPIGAAPPPPGPYVLGVGDLRAKKDFATLVSGWRRLRSAGLEHRLVLAGVDAGEGAALRTAAAGEPLELTGYVEDERLDALMRGADALVHPSRYEGFGLVLLEAMARGTPVLAARCSALPETGGDAALYFEPGDDAQLSDQLEKLLSDQALADRLIASGLERVSGFSWAATAAATADLYRELVG